MDDAADKNDRFRKITISHKLFNNISIKDNQWTLKHQVKGGWRTGFSMSRSHTLCKGKNTPSLMISGFIHLNFKDQIYQH